MSTTRNRADKDRKRRAKLRARLEAADVDPRTIERIIADMREDDRLRRLGVQRPPTRAEILANTDDSLWPDDTGYRPKRHDPLLTGAGRVSGIAAKVVKRRETITRFQHRQMGSA